MSRSLCLVILLTLWLTACAPEQEAPATSEQAATTPTTAPGPRPPVVVTATETFLPFVETEPTPTPPPTATPTVMPSPTATIQPTATTPPTSPIAVVAVEPFLEAGLLVRPTFVTHAFDDRLFVLEQPGRIRVIEDGGLLDDPFLDITDRVGSTYNEQGLLGLAFHPAYATPGASGEGQFWVNYTDLNGDTRISRFSVLPNQPNRADPDSEAIYLQIDQPYPNHNGGMLAFGPDGYLYAGLGDGGSAGDPLNAGQDVGQLLGKLLRLDVDATADAYAIPPDNPFIGQADARPEIWAYGVRNPWRFSFDRATGDLYMADVGQSMWEEINFQPAGSPGGENYGWRILEGTRCYGQAECDDTGLTPPIFEYDHSQGCSVTGGYVYRGAAYPAMVGNYFVADYCSGIIWRLFPEGGRWQAAVVLDSALVIASFGEDVNGELYLTDLARGAIYRLVPGE